MTIKGHILTYEEIGTLYRLLRDVLNDETGDEYPIRIELDRSYLTFHVSGQPKLEMILDLKKE